MHVPYMHTCIHTSSGDEPVAVSAKRRLFSFMNKNVCPIHAYIRTCIHTSSGNEPVAVSAKSKLLSFMYKKVCICPIRTYIHTNERTFKHTNEHTYIRAYIHTYKRTDRPTYIHIHIHTCTHAYTQVAKIDLAACMPANPNSIYGTPPGTIRMHT